MHGVYMGWCLYIHESCLYILIAGTPQPGGVSYLLCSLINNLEVEDPPRSIWWKILRRGGGSCDQYTWQRLRWMQIRVIFWHIHGSCRYWHNVMSLYTRYIHQVVSVYTWIKCVCTYDSDCAGCKRDIMVYTGVMFLLTIRHVSLYMAFHRVVSLYTWIHTYDSDHAECKLESLFTMNRASIHLMFTWGHVSEYTTHVAMYTYEWVMSHLTESCHIRRSQVTHDWVMSNMNESYTTHVAMYIWQRWRRVQTSVLLIGTWVISL